MSAWDVYVSIVRTAAVFFVCLTLVVDIRTDEHMLSVGETMVVVLLAVFVVLRKDGER